MISSVPTLAGAKLWIYPQTSGWMETSVIPPLEGGIHVWLCPLLNAAPEVFAGDSEKERAQDMLVSQKAAQFLRARGYLRYLAAAYLGGGDPRHLDIRLSPSGKPEFADFPWLRFNLSHSSDFAAIAFSKEGDIGIDIEKLRPIPEWQDLRAVLPATAQQRIFAVEDEARPDAFLREFTAFESYGKARGLGLGDFHGDEGGQAISLPEFRDYVGHVCLTQIPGDRRGG